MSGLLRYAWASPATLVGLAIAAPCVAAGGTARTVGGVLEVVAGPVAAVLRRRGVLAGPLAITFGHVVLATDEAHLALARAHEWVHVRQYERWGVLFFPLYLLSSLLALLSGGDPYARNRFERAAFEQSERAPAAG